MAKCPHCGESDNFAAKDVTNYAGEKLAKALCCNGCDKVIHVYNGSHLVYNYGPLMDNMLLELQAISKKLTHSKS